MNAKRGFVPEDERNFSPEALEVMRKASRHISFLINEGYDLKQASVFVGNHFLLSERQRLAIMRSLATNFQLKIRKEKQLGLTEISGSEVWIDGLNTIITMEVLISDSILLSCMDGTIRDLASLRGTYRLIPETSKAIRMMCDILQDVGVGRVNILLDQPVSNSGRLKAKIADIAEGRPFNIDIQVRKDVDRELYSKKNVITSDSAILDHCISWVNLMEECMNRYGSHGIRVWWSQGK